MAIRRAPRWVRIRSKNVTADQLRRVIPSNGKNVILRLGSGTPTERITNLPVDLEINTAEACILSNNKIRMKEAFDAAEVKTAEWSRLDYIEINEEAESDWPHFPAIIKHKNSCRGEGIYYIENDERLVEFIEDHLDNIGSYIIERYYTYVKEYRLHVNKDGCFYTCRKMLKREAEERWHRHDNNSVWILPENELFDIPDNFDEIIEESIKAMNAIGLDICAVDVKVQSKPNPKFIILETNSGPSLGAVGADKYIVEISKMVREI